MGPQGPPPSPRTLRRFHHQVRLPVLHQEIPTPSYRLRNSDIFQLGKHRTACSNKQHVSARLREAARAAGAAGLPWGVGIPRRCSWLLRRSSSQASSSRSPLGVFQTVLFPAEGDATVDSSLGNDTLPPPRTSGLIGGRPASCMSMAGPWQHHGLHLSTELFLGGGAAWGKAMFFFGFHPHHSTEPFRPGSRG